MNDTTGPDTELPGAVFSAADTWKWLTIKKERDEWDRRAKEEYASGRNEGVKVTPW